MDELLEQFLIEGRDLVAQAEADLGRLAGGLADAATLDSALRAVHTLKGSVTIFDMVPAERTLHAAEDVLTAARKGDEALSAAMIDALLACIDQIDRWIDELERNGRIGGDAGERAATLIERLTGGDASARATPAEEADGSRMWLGDFRARAEAASIAIDAPAVAIRYIPDPDCFFRGDDPLAIVSAVPELIHLAVLPRGDWPSAESWDPFRCHAIIEALSTAPIDNVRAAFRLVADQVDFALLSPDAQETAPGSIGGSDGGRTLRIDATRLDALAAEVGELVIAANGLAHVVRLAAQIDPALAAALRAVQGDIDRISGRLHQSVAHVRLVPLSATLRRLPRLVREIAGGLGKSVRFVMRGEATEVDKQIADGLFEPLLHLLRNGLDHGIEMPEARTAAGKKPEASLTIEVARQGDEVVVAVEDDGAGIDPARIRATAVERDIVSAGEAEAMTDGQAVRLILAPGFSTAAKVTDISGRGVGMDAVQVAIDRLRGRIVIDSRLGEGTRIELRLPLDAITTRLLVIRAGQDRYGVRLDQIVETVRIAEADISAVGAGRACVLRDRTVPVLDLASLLGAPAISGQAARLLVTEAGGEPVALRVDSLDARIDAIVRDKSGLLGSLPGISGTTLLGDGDVLLVLDLPELVG